MSEHSITHIRPRFELQVPIPQEVLLEKIKKEISTHPEIKGRVLDNYLTLDVIDEDVHFWSPHLDARVEIDETNTTHSVIYGLIGPRPVVWTMFMFVYFFIGFAGFVITAYGVSNWMIGDYSHTVWAFPITILIMLTAYKAGNIGERLAADQTETLKQIIRNVIK